MSERMVAHGVEIALEGVTRRRKHEHESPDDCRQTATMMLVLLTEMMRNGYGEHMPTGEQVQRFLAARGLPALTPVDARRFRSLLSSLAFVSLSSFDQLPP